MSNERGAETVLNLKIDKVLGSDCSTFAIGGVLESLVTVESEADLAAFLSYSFYNKLSYGVLGNGSNILFPDAGLHYPLIKLGGGFSYVSEIGADEFEVGAGYSLIALSAKLSKLGFSGLEFACGIPASVGGGVFMNAGAFGGSLSDIILWVDIIEATGEKRRLAPSEMQFAYRRSVIPTGSVIIAVGIKLKKDDRDQIEARRLNFMSERRAKQPLEYPSAGSIFKNPTGKKSAGYLLEEVHLKGYTIGGAMFSEKHANWIVNINREATAADVKALILEAQKRVRAAYGIELKTELKIL